MAKANPLWGAPRIHGELLKLGIDISERTISNLISRRYGKLPSQRWRAFLKNQMTSVVSIYGSYFRKRLKKMGVGEVMTAFRSPWQNPFVERLIGSIRRDCLDHVIVLNPTHLSRILSSYFGYYHNDRTHHGIGKDAPVEPPIQPMPGKAGKVIELPRVGGLHHRCEWRQAA
jgi:hypothetical protein